MNARDLKRLEGFHFRFLRRITRLTRSPDIGEEEVDRASDEKVFKVSKVPKIRNLLSEKRLRWFGHLVRKEEGDPARETMYQEWKSNSRWWQQVDKDLREKKVAVEKAFKIAEDRERWRELSSSYSHDRKKRFPRKKSKRSYKKYEASEKVE